MTIRLIKLNLKQIHECQEEEVVSELLERLDCSSSNSS